MGREVITEVDVEDAKTARDAGGNLASGAETPIPSADDYSDRLIKYIPGEIVSVYLFVSGILLTANSQIPAATFKVLQWVVFGFLFLMTPFYLRRVQKVKKKQQWAITTISFAVWVFTLGGPFAQFTWYHAIYGAMLLPLYTFAIATIEAKK